MSDSCNFAIPGQHTGQPDCWCRPRKVVRLARPPKRLSGRIRIDPPEYRPVRLVVCLSEIVAGRLQEAADKVGTARATLASEIITQGLDVMDVKEG